MLFYTKKKLFYIYPNIFFKPYFIYYEQFSQNNEFQHNSTTAQQPNSPTAQQPKVNQRLPYTPIFSNLKQIVFALILSCICYIETQAQTCFFEMERISDTSIRLTATSSTTNTTDSGNQFAFSNASLFDVIPTNQVPVISDNTLQINGQTTTVSGGGGFTFFSTTSSVTGTLSATGSVVLTWSAGQIKGTGNSFDIFHRTLSSIICQVGIVADSQAVGAASIPTLSEWGLIILALLLLTLGTLYLVQPNWRGRFEQEG